MVPRSPGSQSGVSNSVCSEMLPLSGPMRACEDDKLCQTPRTRCEIMPPPSSGETATLPLLMLRPGERDENFGISSERMLAEAERDLQQYQLRLQRLKEQLQQPRCQSPQSRARPEPTGSTEGLLPLHSGAEAELPLLR